MQSTVISEETKQKLKGKEAALNPFELKAGIEAKLKAIWATQREFEQSPNRRSVAPTLATSK